MRLVRPTRKSCDRARLYASLALDGELSELESRRLAAHAAGCAPCRAFAVDVEAFTAELRAAPSEPLRRPVEACWRARSSLRLRSGQLAAAALVLAAVGLGGVLTNGAGPGDDGRPPAGSPRATVTTPIRYTVDELFFSEKLLLVQASTPWRAGPAGGMANRAL